jgi:ribonuclease HI
MEMRAAIAGLSALKGNCHVLLHSDSDYLVKPMSDGRARRWRARGWRRSGRERVLNPDLWATLLDLCERHGVEFIWVKGHAGDAENHRCDQLAREAATGPELAVDEGYARPGS